MLCSFCKKNKSTHFSLDDNSTLICENCALELFNIKIENHPFCHFCNEPCFNGCFFFDDDKCFCSIECINDFLDENDDDFDCDHDIFLNNLIPEYQNSCDCAFCNNSCTDKIFFHENTSFCSIECILQYEHFFPIKSF